MADQRLQNATRRHPLATPVVAVKHDPAIAAAAGEGILPAIKDDPAGWITPRQGIFQPSPAGADNVRQGGDRIKAG